MIKYNFTLGTTPLTIQTTKKATTEILDQIFSLIQFFRFDFNHTIHNSSGYRFNDTKINIPFLTSKEFIQYLKINYDYLSENFNPFFGDEHSKKKIPELIFGTERHTIIKKNNVFFNTQILLQAFIIDVIFDLLLEKDFRDILINTSSFYKADNKRDWEIEFLIENNLSIKDSIRGETKAILYNSQKNPVNRPTGFANKDRVIKSEYIILKANSCVEARIDAFDIFKITTDSGFKAHAQDKKSNFIVIDSNLNKNFYKPNKFL